MRINIVITLLIGVLGIAFVPGCTMSVKPDMKDSTDELLASYRTNSQTIAAAKSYQPNPWRVGQWANYRMTDPKGNVSHIKYAIVAKDECGIWLEVVTQSYYSYDIQKTCYSSMPSAMGYDTKATAQGVIDAVQVTVTQRNNNKPQVIDYRKQDDFTKSMLKSVGPNIGMKFYFAPDMLRDNRKVVAGNFLKAFKVESKLNFGPFAYNAKIWSHPVVPVTGQVYSRSVDGKYTTELLSYGEQGAESVLKSYP